MIKCEPNFWLFAFFNDQTLLSPVRKPKGTVSNTKFRKTMEDWPSAWIAFSSIQSHVLGWMRHSYDIVFAWSWWSTAGTSIHCWACWLHWWLSLSGSWCPCLFLHHVWLYCPGTWIPFLISWGFGTFGIINSVLFWLIFLIFCRTNLKQFTIL